MIPFEKTLSFLGPDLIDQLKDKAVIQEFPAETEILRESQYVKVLPIVLEGLVKVFSRFDDRELLLYYIEPAQSCVMSFSASLKNEPSRVFAVTEEPTKLLLLPVDVLPGWLKSYPSLNQLFYEQYNLRYAELLDTIHHVLFHKMDQRLYDYLLAKSKVTGQDVLKMSHVQMAQELGTAREVITRVIKKLESEGKVSQSKQGIAVHLVSNP
ncbi:Crp/Fnr family transcriptional regulator [bacterium SCSIO 12741]|nr:Crp/Fnr family transcriptional regulator [bacterium SCSIO 12741]